MVSAKVACIKGGWVVMSAHSGSHTTGGGSLLCLLAFPLARACLVEVVQRKEERDDEHLVGKWW